MGTLDREIVFSSGTEGNPMATFQQQIDERCKQYVDGMITKDELKRYVILLLADNEWPDDFALFFCDAFVEV